MKKFLRMEFVPPSADAGLLVLRLGMGATLFIKHGTEKVLNFSAMAATFPDLTHLGGGPTLAIALVSDAICSVLVMFGLLTRWAALYTFFNVLVAWAFVHRFHFFGHTLETMDGVTFDTGDHGELMALMLAGFLALALAGAGRISLDRKLLKL
jgi:putative oxidoreductase